MTRMNVADRLTLANCNGVNVVTAVGGSSNFAVIVLWLGHQSLVTTRGYVEAAIQRHLGTAKLNGLDPAAWLCDTLETLPTCIARDIDSLLPLQHSSLPQSNY